MDLIKCICGRTTMLKSHKRPPEPRLTAMRRRRNPRGRGGRGFSRQLLISLFAAYLVLNAWSFTRKIDLNEQGNGGTNNALASFAKNRRRQDVHVVVSHCDNSIGWIWQQFAKEEQNQRQQHQSLKYNMKSATIITKCNVTISPDDLPEIKGSKPLVQVLSLPNVGRNDHSYAYWIKEVLMGKIDAQGNRDDTTQSEHPQTNLTRPLYNLLYSNHEQDGNPFRQIARNIDPTDLVYFMKDSNNTYRSGMEFSLGFLDVLDLLTTQHLSPNTTTATTYSLLKQSKFSRPISRGMICQSYPHSKKMRSKRRQKKNRYIDLAHRSVLWAFRLDYYVRLSRDLGYEFQSMYRPMGAWINHLAEPRAEPSEPSLPSSQTTKKKPQTVFSKEYYEQVAKTDFSLEGVDPWNYSKPDLVPVCFGGIFATYWGQVASYDSPLTLEGWNAVVDSLSRGGSIEEGHYMERWWGDLLSWSSWAGRTVVGQSTNVEVAAKQEQQKNPLHINGMALPEAEQLLLLEDKTRHVSAGESFMGVVALNGNELE